MVRKLSSFGSVLTSLALIGCSSSPHPAEDPSKASFASATISPTPGHTCSGSVAFTQHGGLVRVAIHLRGLTPGQKHAVHIHEFGNCSVPDSLGEHYNPGVADHGLPPNDRRHAGDLGNVLANGSGDAHVELTVSNFSVVSGSDRSVVGRAVVVRANPDDGSQPSGNAGVGIGCGVIQGR